MRFPGKALSSLALALSVGCSGPQLVVCEQAEARIAILDADEDWADPDALVWEWRAREAGALTEDQRAWFENPTDAKPVLGGESLLVTASGGGVALIRIRDRAVLFRAYTDGNPHSAELLPDGGIVVAASTGSQLHYWRLEEQGAPLQSLPFADAHGVCWDPLTRRLWAVGAQELIALRYAGKHAEKPLEVVERFPLPDPGGHDLARAVDGRLLLSTLAGIWVFDTARTSFEPLGSSPAPADVKSLSAPTHLRDSLPTVLVRAETSWWSDTVRAVQRPDWQRRWPGAQIYKARWVYDGRPPRESPRWSFGVGIGYGSWIGHATDW